MSNRLVCLLLAALAVPSVGCITSTTVQAVPGRAYLIQGHVFGTAVYNCSDSASGPACVPVEEEALK
jgi:hypothetical protein